jgi:hypothetical protein
VEQGLTALLFFFAHALLFGHDLRANAFRVCREGKPLRTFPDHAPRIMNNFIERSFELAAERTDDLTPLVYARLHREHPQTLAMFRTQGSEIVKGSMLALTTEAILDFSGERSGKFRMIECEVSSHDAYGTPRELFFAFFGVIAATLRELLGADWTGEIDKAWSDMLAEIKVIVASHEA